MNDVNDETEINRYTDEQKIVAAVWVHERHYNNQTWEDIYNNFKIRFNAAPPMRTTFMSWERKLFNSGSVKNRDKSGRPLARLMHVPYVKASLKETPHLSLRERAKELGLPRTTLLKILQEDLNMEFEVNVDDNNPNRKHAANNNGVWKKAETEDDKSEITLENIALLPKVKESLAEFPSLSVEERANDLDMSEETVQLLVKKIQDSNSNSEHTDECSKKIKLESEEN